MNTLDKMVKDDFLDSSQQNRHHLKDKIRTLRFILDEIEESRKENDLINKKEKYINNFEENLKIINDTWLNYKHTIF